MERLYYYSVRFSLILYIVGIILMGILLTLLEPYPLNDFSIFFHVMYFSLQGEIALVFLFILSGCFGFLRPLRKRYSIYHRNSVYWSIMLSSFSYSIFTILIIPTVHNLIIGYQSTFFDYIRINFVLILAVIIISSFVGHFLGIQIESPQYEDFLEIKEE